MIIHLFDLKSEMISTGQKKIDFLENNFDVSYWNPDLAVTKVFLISEKHICRPDMLSFEAYGNVNYVDIILKFNQITNPFSMELHDFIVVPKLTNALTYYRKQTLSKSPLVKDIKALYIDPTKASQKDLNRLKQLQKIAQKRTNGSKEILPTNLLRTGELQNKTDGTVMIFNPSSTNLYTKT